MLKCQSVALRSQLEEKDLPLTIVKAAKVATLVLCVGASAGGAQTPPKDLVIRLRYVTVEDRLRPSPATNLAAVRTIVLKLSTTGAISEVYGRGSGGVYNEFQTGGHLGGSEDSRLQWHVVNQNTLVRTRELDQSVQTITVIINGSSCNMTYNNRLKSGFSEVKDVSITLGVVAYYDLARVTDSSCSIE